MPTDFENLNTTATEARFKMEFVHGLASFVRKGTQATRWMTEGAVPMDCVVNAVLAALAQSMASNPSPVETDAVVRERISLAYANTYRELRRTYNRPTAPVYSVTPWTEESLAMRELGAEKLALPAVSPNVAGALAMAWHNVYGAQQRWLLWHCLGAMFYQTPQGSGHRFGVRGEGSCEEKNFQLVSDFLHGQLLKMERHVFMFSLVAGGDAHYSAKKWVLQTALSGGMSIIEYLRPDAAVPGSWHGAEEAAIRDSILAHY